LPSPRLKKARKQIGEPARHDKFACGRADPGSLRPSARRRDKRSGAIVKLGRVEGRPGKIQSPFLLAHPPSSRTRHAPPQRLRPATSQLATLTREGPPAAPRQNVHALGMGPPRDRPDRAPTTGPASPSLLPPRASDLAPRLTAHATRLILPSRRIDHATSRPISCPRQSAAPRGRRQRVEPQTARSLHVVQPHLYLRQRRARPWKAIDPQSPPKELSSSRVICSGRAPRS
jgi:hypothetical protein